MKPTRDDMKIQLDELPQGDKFSSGHIFAGENFLISRGYIFADDPNSNFSSGQFFADACKHIENFSSGK